MTRPLTPAEEAEAGRVLVAAARDEDVYPVVDGEEEDGVDGREAHVVFDAFARELALAGFEIVRKQP